MSMKPRYRLFLRRKSVYYAFDNFTKRLPEPQNQGQGRGRPDDCRFE